MARLVSIIVPCYNAERWVAEAIGSALVQTYVPTEVIVLDDGSTDRSLDIIRSFGTKIRWESGPNRGGNAARNRGFALSKGDYIQFIDADDYLLPEKIERQVARLEATGADVVYGDWRHLHHQPDGRKEFEAIKISGDKPDVLEALLSDWWVACHALLFRRTAVEKCGGWDETIQAAQDRDFFISVLLAGAKAVYQPGCHAIYRRYGQVTVGTSNPRRWLASHCRVLDKSSEVLGRANRLNSGYRHAIALSYFRMARGWFEFDRKQYDLAMSRVLELEPNFEPPGTALYKAVHRLLGFRGAEWVAYAARNVRFGR